MAEVNITLATPAAVRPTALLANLLREQRNMASRPTKV